MITLIFLDFELYLNKTSVDKCSRTCIKGPTLLPVNALLLSTLSLSFPSFRLLRRSREADRSLLLPLSLPFPLSFFFEECLLLCSRLGERDRLLRFDGRWESSEVSESDGEESDEEDTEELRLEERPRELSCSCLSRSYTNVVTDIQLLR